MDHEKLKKILRSFTRELLRANRKGGKFIFSAIMKVDGKYLMNNGYSEKDQIGITLLRNFAENARGVATDVAGAISLRGTAEPEPEKPKDVEIKKEDDGSIKINFNKK